MKLPVRYASLSPAGRRQVREEYIRRQDGLCSHCQAPLNSDPAQRILAKKLNMRLFPRDFLDWPVHLHHSRRTGMTIGAVHARCNGVLWQYRGK